MRHVLPPSRKIKSTDKLDTLALVVGVIQPLATLPQIFLVYSSQDASQVSLFMWTSYNVASVVLLAYGFKYKLTPIIWAQVLWLLVQTPMMLAVFIF